MPATPPAWNLALDHRTRGWLWTWVGTVMPVVLALGVMAAATRYATQYAWDAVICVGGALATLLLALMLLVSLLAGADRTTLRHAPARTDTVRIDGADHQATAFPVDRARRWRWLPVVVAVLLHGLFCLSVLLLSHQTWPHARWPLGIWGVLAVGLGCWLAVLTLGAPQTAITRRRLDSPLVDLALVPDGILVDGSQFVAWDDVTSITAVDESMPGPFDWHWPAVEIATAHDRVRVRMDGHREHPVTMLTMLNHYWRRPHDRSELGTPAAVVRSRTIAY